MTKAPEAVWRRVTVVAALMVAAFSFNTTENLPIGLLELIATDLHVSVPSVGYLVTGYGLTVAVVSLPLAHVTRSLPRRHLLAGLLAALVLASWGSALVSSYPLLLAARVVTAVAQALFWAVMGPVAVGLFAPERRGRVIGMLSFGGSLATVAGVPAGTWLGQHADWQAPFWVLSALGLVALVPVAGLLPTSRPEEGHAAYGVAPDTRSFGIVLATTALSVTGAFAGFTYVVGFLHEVAGFSAAWVSGLLSVFGVAGVVGVSVTGPLLDRFPRGTLTVPVAAQGVALLVMSGAGTDRAVAVAMLALLGAAVGPVFMATQNRVLRVAPGRTEMALAGNSAAFNLGVAAGALLGGLVLPLVHLRGTFLVGGLLTLAALALLLGEGMLPTPGRKASAPSAPALRTGTAEQG
ncbi:MFS transporter [Streptomyces sp. NPDC059740]|uniref:MFS transporter n=1 Tax=Streptomyces sp. NPDC059740 TaxID=3346926 RepID=UPI003661CD29